MTVIRAAIPSWCLAAETVPGQRDHSEAEFKCQP